MTRIEKFSICFVVASLCMNASGQTSTAAELLQKGIYLEETTGDLDGAIHVYKQVAKMTEESRSNAAQAEFRMGVCLQKKGHPAEALSTFQNLIRDYPEQVDLVARARQLLPVEAKPPDAIPNPCQPLEDQILLDPGDVAIRERTVSCYFGAQVKVPFRSDRQRALEKSRVEHVLWLIQHESDKTFLDDTQVDYVVDPEHYIRMRREWMDQVQAHPHDANVLTNAARFLDLDDKEKAEELAARAYDLDPKNLRAADVLATLIERTQFEYFGHIINPGFKILRAKQALELREQIWNGATPEGHMATRPLEQMALDAIDADENLKAQKYAEELSQHDDGDAIHEANMILGRLALKNGNVEEAKKRLLAAGKTSGSAALSSFGPTMLLAQELLKKGEQEVVLQYFDECQVFWKSAGSRLDEWRQVVRLGRIPDFGGNLRY